MADKKIKAKTVKAKEAPVVKAKPEIGEVAITEIVEEEKDWGKNEIVEFTGKYIRSVGRRKKAVAQVRLYEGGKGIIVINGQRAAQYFSGEGFNLITQPLKVTGHNRDFNFSILVNGGGKSGQTIAVRLGISRAIFLLDPATKEALKVNNFLTRDPRQVERKKPGFKKARKRPQWSKR
jgi:small subunit ribosomal protein S9